MADDKWTKIQEFPEPSPKEPDTFKLEILTETTLVTIAIALLIVAAAEPVAKQHEEVHIFEEYPGCQAKVGEAQYIQKDVSHCLEEIEFCFNENQCSLSVINEDRYKEYRAELPRQLSNKTYYYRLRNDLDKKLEFRQFNCLHREGCFNV